MAIHFINASPPIPSSSPEVNEVAGGDALTKRKSSLNISLRNSSASLASLASAAQHLASAHKTKSQMKGKPRPNPVDKGMDEIWHAFVNFGFLTLVCGAVYFGGQRHLPRGGPQHYFNRWKSQLSLYRALQGHCQGNLDGKFASKFFSYQLVLVAGFIFGGMLLSKIYDLSKRGKYKTPDELLSDPELIKIKGEMEQKFQKLRELQAKIQQATTPSDLEPIGNELEAMDNEITLLKIGGDEEAAMAELEVTALSLGSTPPENLSQLDSKSPEVARLQNEIVERGGLEPEDLEPSTISMPMGIGFGIAVPVVVQVLTLYLTHEHNTRPLLEAQREVIKKAIQQANRAGSGFTCDAEGMKALLGQAVELGLPVPQSEGASVQHRETTKDFSLPLSQTITQIGSGLWLTQEGATIYAATEARALEILNSMGPRLQMAAVVPEVPVSPILQRSALGVDMATTVAQTGRAVVQSAPVRAGAGVLSRGISGTARVMGLPFALASTADWAVSLSQGRYTSSINQRIAEKHMAEYGAQTYQEGRTAAYIYGGVWESLRAVFPSLFNERIAEEYPDEIFEMKGEDAKAADEAASYLKKAIPVLVKEGMPIYDFKTQTFKTVKGSQAIQYILASISTSNENKLEITPEQQRWLHHGGDPSIYEEMHQQERAEWDARLVSHTLRQSAALLGLNQSNSRFWNASGFAEKYFNEDGDILPGLHGQLLLELGVEKTSVDLFYQHVKEDVENSPPTLVTPL